MKIRLTFLSLFFYFSQYSFSQELCPPASIDVFGGDQQNIVSWGEPVGNIGCGDYAINELPFTAQGNNTGTGDNWPVSGTNGDDVAYTLNVGQATTFDFTLCSIVSMSKGSDAANKIASTCLSNFVGDDGKLIILFFFLSAIFMIF